MTHLELENLASDYLEGLLEPARKAQVEAHLAECLPCRELMEDVRRAVELCRAAEKLEPAPWLVPKILLATVGARKPRLDKQLAAFFRPALHPRLAYALAMAVFSLSIIVNAAGINLRNFRFEDLNPGTWLYRATRAGHLLVARVEKFYYDLRVVYEIEYRFRQFQSQPKQEKESPKQAPPAGGSTDSQQPANPQLASNGVGATAAVSPLGPDANQTGSNPHTPGAIRSSSP